MTSVLFAWEFGANLGHVGPLAAIARGLPQDDFGITFAVRNLANARIVLGESVPLIQSPVIWPRQRRTKGPTAAASFLDELADAGFANPDNLAAVIAAWRSIFDLVRPDAIVADFSPGLQLAAYGQGIPIVHVGIPYAMPPLDHGQFPPLRADKRAMISEERLLDAIRKALGRFDTDVPDRLVDLFQTDARVCFTLPELDPYRPFRREPVYLPPEPLPEFTPPPNQPRLFAYLGAEMEDLEDIVQALGGLDIPVSAYIRGDAGPMATFLSLRGHNVFDTPPNLAKLLPTISHVLSPGGAFTSQAALAAGRPHFVVPQHSESEANSELLEAMGVARSWTADAKEVSVTEEIDQFLHQSELVQRARHWGKIFGLRTQAPDGLQGAISAISRILKLDWPDVAPLN